MGSFGDSGAAFFLHGASRAGYGRSCWLRPRLLDCVRDAIRARHYSRRTEKAYVGWIKRYIFFHAKRHPMEMGAPEVARFLTSLAVDGRVAAAA